MPSSKKNPNYFRYFDDLLEDYPVSLLPQDLHTCGSCGQAQSTCHMLVASKKGKKAGIKAVVIIRCAGCGSVHRRRSYSRLGCFDTQGDRERPWNGTTQERAPWHGAVTMSEAQVRPRPGSRRGCAVPVIPHISLNLGQTHS